MLELSLKKRQLKVLCIGAHPDDIEIGCGGSIFRISEEFKTDITWVILSGDENRKNEAMNSAKKFLEKSENHEIFIKSFKESYFPYIGDQIKDFFEELKKVSPDLIFTHYRHDLHQDHRLLSELTWNTFRDHFILEYEIPKYDGDLLDPNLYINLNKETCENKIGLISSEFKTQSSRRWFDKEIFWAILRMRGLESNSPSKYAEAFHSRKISI
jgi:LmbE family N-acetylglucosaminyl deacetylase